MTYLGRVTEPPEYVAVASPQVVTSGSYVAIGAFFFDYSKLGVSVVNRAYEVRFRAILEVSAPGATAEVVLYRPSDNTILTATLLTSTPAAETGPETLASAALLNTGGVTLSPDAKTYEVYLRKSAGAGPDSVVCKWAGLTVVRFPIYL